jgi:glutaconate CoA-transferase, subunit A
LLHAARADVYGNVVHCGGPGWLDLFLQRAAQRSIVQVEKIIPNEEVRADPWATTIARADVVVRMPYGAHPYYSRGHYVQDSALLQDYVRAAEQDGAPLAHFLNRYCREPSSHGDYLQVIGIKRLLALYEY